MAVICKFVSLARCSKIWIDGLKGCQATRNLHMKKIQGKTMPTIGNACVSVAPAEIRPNPDRPSFYEQHNGEKMQNIFPPSEFEQRLSKLRNHMTMTNIDACILTSYHNICYFTGFMFCYFGRQYACIVTPDKVTTVSAGIDGGQTWRRGYGDNIVYTDWEKTNYYKALQHALKDQQSNCKLGLELDNLSVENANSFRHVFPTSIIEDVGKPTMFMRMLKSPGEIEVIKQGARIADIGGAACVEALHEGVNEYEVALHSTNSMVKEIAATYPQADILDTWTWFQSGLNTDGAHNPVTSRRVQKGDILSINCFPMIQGYYTALERTLFLDHVPDAALRIWEHNVAVHERGLELIKPGARCCDIAMELNEMYREVDLLQYRSFGYGHSFGVLCHYYGREAGLELREDCTTVLEPNMVVSMEPMVTIPETGSMPGAAGGYREHDILVLTENGAENITKFPYGPEHNIIKA